MLLGNRVRGGKAKRRRVFVSYRLVWSRKRGGEVQEQKHRPHPQTRPTHRQARKIAIFATVARLE
jgi:hypothetical protein